MRRRTQERRATRRIAILDAFVELCAERGYAETTLAAVAARAGIPESELQAEFADKEACGIAAQNENLVQVILAVSSTYDPDRAEVDSGVAAIAAILELMVARPSWTHFGFIVSRQMATPGTKAIYDTGHRTMEAILERGWDYSGTNQKPSLVARGVFGAAEALVRRELAHGRADRLPQLLPDCVYIAAVPFLGQKEAMRLMALAREKMRRRDDDQLPDS